MFKNKNKRYFAIRVTDYMKLVNLCKVLKIKKYSLMDEYFKDTDTGLPSYWIFTTVCYDKKYEVIKKVFNLTEEHEVVGH